MSSLAIPVFGLALLVGLGRGVTKEAAPPICRLALDAGEREARALGGDSLRGALADASGCEIVTAPGEPNVLRVRIVGRRVRLELRVSGRDTLVRLVTLDADPHERARAVVIVATHMLRNEADELLGLLGRSDASEGTEGPDASGTEAVTASPAEPIAGTVTEVAEPITAPSPPAVAPAEAATDAQAVPAAEAEAHESTAAAVRSDGSEASEADEADEAGRGTRGPPIVRLGLTGLVSSVPSGAGSEATLIGGLEIAATPTPWLAIGVRDVMGGVPLGVAQAWSVGGGAFAELSLRVIDWLAIEGQIGADLRAIGVMERTSAGVAPFAVVGARAFVLPELSVSLQSALHVAATDLWATSLDLVPRGAVVWSGGLAVGVHL
ncbi:MAG: hypothetical protein K1X94_10235 [Sandaracinaceae bacterium]|nr:hypothetical protein [Sandaracinaceae bacterium]